MKGTFAALAGGVAAALGMAAAWEVKQGRAIKTEKLQRAITSAKKTVQAVTEIDINTARREQLAALPGVSGELADRIMDNRPYRNKLELLSRLIVNEDVYNSIKRRLQVNGSNDAVKTA